MDSMTASITRTFEVAWDRTLARLAGLQGDEYFWEPVAGCWSLRQDERGRWLLDGDGGGGPTPSPVPVTTIAWRVGHIAGTVGGFARMRFGDGRPLTVEELEVPADVRAVEPFLAVHYRSWMDGLLALPEAEWLRPIGEAFGSFAESNTVDLALHVLDELVHHAAEVGVLRDLWSAGLR